MSGPTTPPGSLTGLLAALYALGLDEFGDELNVYPLWEPNVALPALWHWILPGSVERPSTDPCRISETVKITATLAPDPAQHQGADVLYLAEWADRYRDAIDGRFGGAALASSPFGGAKFAKRTGLALINERLGETSVLSIEFPLEFVLERRVEPTP